MHILMKRTHTHTYTHLNTHIHTKMSTKECKYTIVRSFSFTYPQTFWGVSNKFVFPLNPLILSQGAWRLQGDPLM